LLDDDNVTLQLVDGNEVRQKYMTLSHCWGILPKDILTTKSNLSHRQSSISLKELTPTFRNAVQVTSCLGIGYLWIDAICITQDSTEDWVAESMKMGDIYQNSFLTIAASKGGDSFSGCFNQESTSTDRLQRPNTPPSHPGFEQIYEPPEPSQNRIVTDVVTSMDNGENSTIIFWYEAVKTEPLPLVTSPLNQRGWILQERILSPRAIHYTASQLVWECQQHYELEDRSPVSTLQTKSSMLRRIRDAAGLTPYAILDHWYGQIVSADYAGRVFTKFSDRLIALAGLAKIYQNPRTGGYVGGLWKPSIAFGLAWDHQRPGSAGGKPTHANLSAIRPGLGHLMTAW
jgi:Heterokaryon incompatibility protein (HET)